MTTTKNDDARAERLKAALRENLRRRKVQVRGRGEPSAERSESMEGASSRGDKPAQDEP